MFEKEKKGILGSSSANEKFFKDPSNSAPGSAKVIIGSGVHMKGEITSASEVQIDGDADLNMEIENLMIGQQGKLKGDIKTKNADVWGKFDGDIECSSTLTIQEKGIVKGTTKYSSLQIKLGGQLQGDVQTIEKAKIKAVPSSSESSSSSKSS